MLVICSDGTQSDWCLLMTDRASLRKTGAVIAITAAAGRVFQVDIVLTQEYL